MADNYNPDNNNDIDEVEAVKNKAKETAQNTGKQVVKKTGEAIVKSAIGRRIILGLLAVILLPLFLIMVPLIALMSVVGVVKLISDVKDNIQAFFDGFNYDTETMNTWFEEEDPDCTYQLHSVLDDYYNNAFAKGLTWIEKAKATITGDDEDMLSDSLEMIDDLMRPEHFYLSPKDSIDILELCLDENKEMFRKSKLTYEYQTYRLERKDELGVFVEWAWHKYPDGSLINNETKVNTDEDGIYGIVTAENVRGEELEGSKIYSVHWQDLMALAYYYSNEKSDDKVDGWGTSDTSEYDPQEGTEYEVNSTIDYYFTKSELKSLFNIFKFNPDYRWNAVEHSDSYSWNRLSTNPRIAYRYSRVEDPYDMGPFDTDPPDYDGEYDTPTKFVPDTAPNKVSNKIETHRYVYISTEDVDGYTPDPENFEPPVGEYCIGKWRVINPEPFVNQMAVLCPWYLERDSEEMRAEGYNWAEEMMDMYIFYLELIESSLGSTERTEYYKHIKELYLNNQIEVLYYGMKPSDEAIAEYVDDLRSKFPDKEFVFNFEHAVEYGEFYVVNTDDPKNQAKNGTIPFPSYGVTYHGNAAGEVDSGNTDVEHNYVGDVFISQADGHYVNGWIHIIEGADTPLDGGYYYTRDEIYAMFQKITNEKTSAFNWLGCVDDVYEYNQATGVDIAALLAIIYTEYSPKIGNPTYNWYNLTASSGEAYYKTSESSQWQWLDPKTTYQSTYSTMKTRAGTDGYSTLEGCCMVECMDSIVRRFWKKGQNTFYTMCFNQYGYPQSWDEAEAAMPGIYHAYCPWWQDIGYITTGYNSDYMWCNKNAIFRTSFRHAAGITS